MHKETSLRLGGVVLFLFLFQATADQSGSWNWCSAKIAPPWPVARFTAQDAEGPGREYLFSPWPWGRYWKVFGVPKGFIPLHTVLHYEERSSSSLAGRSIRIHRLMRAAEILEDKTLGPLWKNLCADEPVPYIILEGREDPRFYRIHAGKVIDAKLTEGRGVLVIQESQGDPWRLSLTGLSQDSLIFIENTE